ncbi:E2 domain-associated cysteine-rich protein [Acinetobacter oleivorans]|uniref:E2 domain-associated cysteine-rich protein n=1 Tax=Acinetobacter oleivorans TaxID=1148157 RepID=UPI003A8586D5
MQQLNNFKEYLHERGLPFSCKNNDCIEFSLKVTDLSGKRVKFNLQAIQVRNKLKIRETDNRLPSFCPNRHINSDNSFCLGTDEDLMNITVKDFYQKITSFLKAQLQVEKFKCWPFDYSEWAHGDGAIYQKKVEENLMKIDLKSIGISLNKLNLVEKKNKSFPDQKYLQLFHGSNLLVTYVDGIPHNKRNSCICTKYGKRKHITLKNCKRQCAKILYNIASNELKRIDAEAKFWERCKALNSKCCQTMSECGLK